MHKLISIITALLLVLSAVGCKKTKNNLQISVFTSILPQKYFVEKIASDRLEVEVLVGQGKSPATYDPTPQQVIALGNAKALFTIGVPFENAFLPTIQSSLKSLEIIDTSSGITKRTLESHNHDGEDHKDKSNKGIQDPHIWLSPSLVKIQAENIYSALIKIDPDGLLIYKKGYQNLIKELDDVNTELKNTLAPFKGNTIFVFHPAFGYFADEYGLKQEAIETGGKEPSPSTLEEIIEHAKEEHVKIIFVQPEFSLASAQKIADAIGGAVVMLNPLNPDYINNLKLISSEIEKAFK